MPLGKEVLALALQVTRDHGRRALKDVLRGAIVLLQANYFCFRKILLELENVLDVRATPRIDALVLIANHADVVLFAGKQLHQLVLRTIRILILVDKDVA